MLMLKFTFFMITSSSSVTFVNIPVVHIVKITDLGLISMQGSDSLQLTRGKKNNNNTPACKSLGTSFSFLCTASCCCRLMDRLSHFQQVQHPVAGCQVCESFSPAAKKQRLLDIFLTHPFYSTSPAGQLVSVWRFASRETLRNTGKLFGSDPAAFGSSFDGGLQNVAHRCKSKNYCTMQTFNWFGAKMRKVAPPLHAGLKVR